MLFILGIIIILACQLMHTGGNCPKGWEKFGNNCYMYFGDQMVSWAKAEFFCQQHVDNGHLASIHSLDELNFLFKIINDSNTHYQHMDHYHHNFFNSEFIWIGLSTMCPDKRRRWTDNTRVDFDLLQEVDSPTEKHNQKCVAYFLKKKWMAHMCSSQAPYICKVPMNATHEDPNHKIDDDKNPCGDWNWCYHKDKCYKMETNPKVWLDARHSCLESGADLLSVHSNDELQYLSQKLLIGWDFGQSFWSGLNKYESMDDRFRWADNSPLDYVPLMTIEYLEWRAASCVLLTTSQLTNEQVWKLDRCDTKHMSLCVKPSRTYTAPIMNTTTNQPTSTPGYCRDGWIIYGNKCYKVHGVTNSDDRTDFFNASNVCYHENARLTSIKDVYENLFIMSLVQSTAEFIWLGLIYKDGRLHWLDETKVSFVSFDGGSLATYAFEKEQLQDKDKLPVIEPHLFSWQRRCFTMAINKSPGIWEPIRTMRDFKTLVPVPQTRTGRSPSIKRSFTSYVNWRHQLTNEQLCERESYSFVCESTVSSKKIKNSNEDSIKCGNDTDLEKSFRFRNSCYHFIILPKNWDSAKQYCQMRSNDGDSVVTHLTSINNIFEFGFVSSMAHSIGLSQFWIGLSEKPELGTFAWTDNWPESFSQWGSGEPRTLATDRCVKMQLNDENGGQWFTANCDYMLPYVCKSTSDVAPAPDLENGTCPDKWFTGSSQCYRVISDDWTSGANAVLRCWREYNATLASFRSKSDIERIIERPEVLNAKRRFFVGLVQKLHGGYEWLTGDPVSFVNWAPQEPRYAWNANVEVCVEMDHNGLWYDVGCYETRHFICSLPKTPLEPKTETGPTTTPNYSQKSSDIEISTWITTKNDNLSNKNVKDLFSQPKKHKNQQPEARPVNKGAAFGAAVSVSFLMACIFIISFYVYKKRKVFKCFRQSDVSMRFEILNEIDDA